MCDCYKIGGPWIAEDPNCPVHGTEARIKTNKIEALKTRADQATNLEEVTAILKDFIDLQSE
jgi:hypothetical protein